MKKSNKYDGFKVPTSKEIKKIQIEMLRFFNDYCNENGINYFLMYGSLLGAARHKGMIPWDDDIDLVIPRPDYEKLVKIFNDNNSRYKLISIETNPEFTAPLAKIIDTNTILVQNYGYKEKVELGIYMDLFVFDGLSNDEKERKREIKKALRLTKEWTAVNHKFRYENSPLIKDIARSIYYLPSNILGYRSALKRIEKHSKKYDYDNQNYIGNLSYVLTDRESYPKSYFEKEYMDFEGIKCPVPKEYNRILYKQYGEWTKLPPKDKRKSHHNYECYIKEKVKL